MATVDFVDEAAGTITLSYHKMYVYGADGSPQQCIMESDQMVYPDDCSTTQTLPSTSSLTLTVQREEIEPLGVAAWCPLKSRYVGNITHTGDGGYGPQYKFKHNQADFWLKETPPYTEYVEVGLEIPVYLLRIETGASRGMGHSETSRFLPQLEYYQVVQCPS